MMIYVYVLIPAITFLPALLRLSPGEGSGHYRTGMGDSVTVQIATELQGISLHRTW